MTVCDESPLMQKSELNSVKKQLSSVVQSKKTVSAKLICWRAARNSESVGRESWVSLPKFLAATSTVGFLA